MDCQYNHTTISAYFDGELKGEALSAFERHLETCEACGTELERLERLRAASRSLKEVVPGDEFFKQLKSRIETGVARDRIRTSRPERVFFAAAAAILVLVVLIFAFPSKSSVTPHPGVPAIGMESADLEEFDLEAEIAGLVEPLEEESTDMDEPRDFSLEGALDDFFEGEEILLASG